MRTALTRAEPMADRIWTASIRLTGICCRTSAYIWIRSRPTSTVSWACIGAMQHERLLTPAMINNYIKDRLIPRAEAKKYTPAHLALLIMIGTLKQVLSIRT